LSCSLRRSTGLRAVGDVRWGAQVCHGYRDRSDLLDTLVPYSVAGWQGAASSRCALIFQRRRCGCGWNRTSPSPVCSPCRRRRDDRHCSCVEPGCRSRGSARRNNEQLGERLAQAMIRSRDEKCFNEQLVSRLSHELSHFMTSATSAMYLMRLPNRTAREYRTLEQPLAQLQRIVDDGQTLAEMARGPLALHRQPTNFS
jgi:hypothetical protein